jgi:hypothetical protein
MESMEKPLSTGIILIWPPLKSNGFVLCGHVAKYAVGHSKRLRSQKLGFQNDDDDDDKMIMKVMEQRHLLVYSKHRGVSQKWVNE